MPDIASQLTALRQTINLAFDGLLAQLVTPTPTPTPTPIPNPAPSPSTSTNNVLPALIPIIQAKAQANTPQWQAFKAKLDANLNIAGLGAYQAGAMHLALDYAAGYVALKTIDPATAAKYAMKSIGILRVGLTSSMHGVETGKIFLGRGNGTATSFTVPDAGFVPTSPNVFTSPIVTKSVVKGKANAADLYGVVYNLPLKVSKTLDGAADYVQGVDWQINPNLWLNVTDWAYRLIDWSLSTANQPVTGTTYYVTSADFMNGWSAPLVLNKDYTINAGAITFSVPPASNVAVWGEYLYSANGLDYQHSSNGLGGMPGVFVDSGYTSRQLGLLAIATDWLWDFSQFPVTLRTQALTQFNNWSNWIRDNAYGNLNTGTNYGAGHYMCRAAIAACAQGRDAARLASEVQALHTGNATFMTSGSFAGGYYPDGPNYGPGSIQNIHLGGLILEGMKLADTTVAHANARDVILTGLHGTLVATLPNGPVYCDPQGDGYTDPLKAPFVNNPDVWYILAFMCQDPTIASYANYLIQNYPIFDGSWHPNAPTLSWIDLAFRDPNAPASNGWLTTLPTTRFIPGMGIVYARKDWSYQSTWMAFRCSPNRGEHASYNQGEVQLWHGPDRMLVRPQAISQMQAFQLGSRFGNLVTIDDLGAGYMNYPSTSGYGPAQSGEYGPLANTIGTVYEAGKDYVYCQGNYAATYCATGTGKYAATELMRSIMYLPGSDYLLIQDRATTVQPGFLKTLQWSFDPKATLTRSGDAWQVTNGVSCLFAHTYSDVPLASVNDSFPLGYNNPPTQFPRIRVNPVTPIAKIRYRTALQSSPNSVMAMDASNDIPSSDGQCEGIQIGKVVVVFGSNGPITGNASYLFTGQNGVSYQHYVTDLVPGHAYSLVGSIYTASAKGVVSFTIMGTGAQQTIGLVF